MILYLFFPSIVGKDIDYEEWTELYNDSDTLINLQGYYISDDFLYNKNGY